MSQFHNTSSVTIATKTGATEGHGYYTLLNICNMSKKGGKKRISQCIINEPRIMILEKETLVPQKGMVNKFSKISVICHRERERERE